MVYTGKENDYSLTFMQYFCLINGKAFVLTYTAEANEFENTLEIATKIMDSFVLKQK
jgi:hypothetical protein